MATAQDIQGFYGLLGRAPDQEGLDYWTKRANEGMSMDAIRQSFQNVATAGTDPLKPQGLLATGNVTQPPPQPALLSPPGPAYQGETGQQSQDFMRGLIAKGLDVNDPNFYLNPEWQAHSLDEYNKTAPMREAMQKQYAEQGYVGPAGWMTTPPDVLASQLAETPALRESWRQYLPPEAIAAPPLPAARPPGMGGNNPPPGPLPWQAQQGLLASRPPVPGQYNQGMTGAPAGSFPRPTPNYWNGNDFVIPHFQTPASRPTTPLLPTGISDGSATAGGNAPQSTGSTGGIIAGAALPAVAGLVGAGGAKLTEGLRAIPGGAALLSALGAGAGAMDGLIMGADGRLSRAPSPPGALPGTSFVSPQSQTFMQNFNAALKPGWMNTIGAGLAALPDLLQGDYAQAAGAGLGTYAGAAAGTALGAGIGGVLGNFVIPGIGGVAGGLLGKQLGGIFGPGKSVGPNAGANLAVNNGMAQFNSSGADNKGNTQYVDQFINAVAMGANEAATANGVKLSDGGYRISVEVIKGKLNVVGADGVKRSFEPDQGKEAYQYAVGSLLKSGKA